jgi:hypothetical protein
MIFFESLIFNNENYLKVCKKHSSKSMHINTPKVIQAKIINPITIPMALPFSSPPAIVFSKKTSES